MDRKDAERQSRQAFIVDSARRLIFERGLEAASMDDIARAAGYTRRTLYAYFRSRDDVCLQVFLAGLRI